MTAAPGTPRACVVSLHDVSPLTRADCARMLEELAGLGVARCSLLVIPNHHGRAPIRSDHSFCRWLEALASQGHELVVHGYLHERARQSAEGLRTRLITRVYTRGEGEFYDLAEADAARLLERALADFAELDVPRPRGFIAPAWLLGKRAQAAVRAAGFRYTTRLTEVEDFEGNRLFPARSLVYSCRRAWRRVCSLAWNAGLAKYLGTAPLLRLSLHPPDCRYPRIWRQIRGLVSEAANTRRIFTYDTFLDGVTRE